MGWINGQRCLVCGCSDERACPGGCMWVEPGLCSACVGKEGTVTVTYRGERGRGATWRVFRDHRPLSPKVSQKVRNHSPTGFSWGFGGSGPAQLALALLLDVLDRDEAQLRYQAFKWDVVAR